MDVSETDYQRSSVKSKSRIEKMALGDLIKSKK